MAKHQQNVTVHGNTVTIYKMENQFCVSDFIRRMQNAIRYINRDNTPENEIKVICLCAREHIFPDACVPIAAIINEYRIVFGIKITTIIKNNRYLEKTCFSNPKKANKKVLNPLNKIFVYDAKDGDNSQAVAINQALVDTMSRTIKCEDGVLAGMLWSVYEVMDNVLAHSQSPRGYFMAQYHKDTARLAICVYDCGIGIKDSLELGDINTETEIEAINMAMQDGVGESVKNGLGQGNGLYGLAQFVKANGGRLAISSGKSTVSIKPNEIKQWDNNPIIDNYHKSTTIDFQLELSNKTDLKSALKSIGGIEDFDIRIDDMIQEKSGWIVYKVVDNTNDISLRQSGKALRIDIENILRRTKSPIAIDFSDILVASSSFIDEFIAKMYIDLGSVQFNQLISLTNMNDDLSYLCNRAIAKRINSTWNA